MDKTLISEPVPIPKDRPILLIVDPNDIDYIWEDVEPLIDIALSYSNGELLSQDVRRMVMTEQQTLWVGLKDGEIFCAGTTEIVTYPRKKLLRVITFATKNGHDYKYWKSFEEVIEGFAIRRECSALEAWTRKGLAKKLDWDHEYSVITKDIKDKWQ